MSAAQFLNLTISNASNTAATGSPFGFVTRQEVINMLGFYAEQSNFNLWWKAAIGFCVACCLAEWLETLGVFRWMARHKWAYYLAFRKPPEDNKANEDDKKENAPPETRE